MRIFILLTLILLASCAPNRMVDGQRHGRWKEVTSDGHTTYKSVGRYRHGEEVRRWRHYQNGKLAKTERYRDTLCELKFYHPNGKVASSGITKVVLTEKERHWFYSGDWQYFDENGRLTLIRTYKEGQLLGEREPALTTAAEGQTGPR